MTLHTQTAYYSSSLRALYDLGKRLGYTLVGSDEKGVNGFFVRSDILACQGVKASALLLRLLAAAGHAKAGSGTRTRWPPCWLLANRRAASPLVAPSQLSHPPTCSPQPLPFEELYTPMVRYAWHGPETNQSRKWLFLDEQGNVVRREFKPV